MNIDIVFNGRSYGADDYKNFINSQNGCQVQAAAKVVVAMRRSPELLFAILMLFENNCPCIPVDTSYPRERIQYIISDAAPRFIMTDSGIHANTYLNPMNSKQNNDESDAAYILYTSGSTGNPKGVEVRRDAFDNYIEGICEIIDFSPGKRIACLTTVSFDIFLMESVIALYKGLTVVLGNEDEQRNPKFMGRLIADGGVDILQMTPSRMQLLLNHDKELNCLKNVKEILIGGEPLPLNLLRVLKERTPARIYNMYGPTEATIWATVSDLTEKDSIDIGRPLKNTAIYIVDENMSVLPHGQTGEICIGGKSLAKGYVDLDDLTVEKFIYLPDMPEERVFRTGDAGRVLPDGNIEYLYRMDNQLKIRGYRVELEEIEVQLNQYAGIRQSVVTVYTTGDADMVLEAFYTSEADIPQNNLMNHLSQKLPSYMIPALFKRVEDFIWTGNGKIDRKRVRECTVIEAGSESAGIAPTEQTTEVQRKILQVIKSRVDQQFSNRVVMAASFEESGVDSLVYVELVVALEGEFDIEFDDEMIVTTAFSGFKGLVEYVESKVGER
ncbi:MAG: amino acid adenylation domain-containing protein [Defluviitaleaceae bacterium]|nr:amino acid adenylation domain-containing protein [Defluviitaleaceae bacterium]